MADLKIIITPRDNLQ